MPAPVLAYMDHVFSIAPSFDGPPDPGLSPNNGRPEHFNSPFGWKSNVAAQRGRDYETSPKLLRAMFFHNSLIRKRRVASVPLKPHAHREASVKTAMTILLICTAALSGCATRPDQAGPTAQSAISRALDKRIIDCALPYPTNNSLLLEGTAAQIAMARRIIAQLDIPKDQVELSLWVIDIHKQDADALGAKWGAVGKVGPVDVRLNGSLLGQGSTLSRAQTLQFIASVTALSEQNKARIVSRPILLAQDNSPAVFDNSKSFYVKIHGERTATLHKVTYGTMINVVPHVVDSRGRIEMELAIEDGNSSNPKEDSGLDLPIVSSTKISTMARVQHQQSILVGGYTLDETSENTSKIPVLGDIPMLGKLFTYKSNNGSKSVRLFLIQPRLLAEDSTFDSKRISTPKEIDNAVDALRAQMEGRHG